MLLLWRHVSSLRKKQIGILVILMIIVSFFEIISIGAVIPFLTVFIDPDILLTKPEFIPILSFFGINSHEELLGPLTAIFILLAISAGLMRVILLFVSTRISFSLGADLSYDIYRRTLYQPYEVHISRNSSEVVNGVAVKVNLVITSIVIPVLNLMGSLVIMLAIVSMMLYIDVFAALFSILFFSSIYVLVAFFTKRKLLVNSQHAAEESTQVIKTIQEGLGSIRDILINNTQNQYCKRYRQSDLKLRKSQASNLFIAQSPRYGIESLGIAFIAVLAYLLTQNEGETNVVVPLLGAIALGAQRLLPLMQNIYMSWSNIKGGISSIYDTLSLLDQKESPYQVKNLGESLSFEKSITLSDVSFQYNLNSIPVISNINLTINKGERIGFFGESGCGKSTLLDIIMGLLIPTSGEMRIDGKNIKNKEVVAWRENISHVSQNIFLNDSSIEENIAFGIPKIDIDHARVKKVVKQAQLDVLISQLPLGVDTRVGEDGVLLSGGQKQRIGIARALYRRSKVIVFDEATSALDEKTELHVMRAIDSLSKDLTVIIVAHRLSTLKHCSKLYELNKDGVSYIKSYNDLFLRK